MVRTNNDFFFSKKNKPTPSGLAHIKEGVDSILKNNNKPRRKNESWTKRRILSTILATYREYKIRKESGVKVVFNTSFFLRYGNGDAKFLIKKKPSYLAMRFYKDEVDDIKELEDLDLEGLMKLTLPIGTEREEILGTFEKGWKAKRIIKTINDVYAEYKIRKESGEEVVFNTSFFTQSSIKDGNNLTKKLKEFSLSALGDSAKNITDIRSLIVQVYPESPEKDSILKDFKKRNR